MNNLDNIHIILVGTTHPGNIGATARAMKTMGLSKLILVQPQTFPHPQATARASGAADILTHTQVFDDFASSLSAYQYIFATSARPRRIHWPTLSPREFASTALTYTQPIAILFGREHSGLTNEELDHCHYLIHIPTQAEYRSLNLAAAVQIITYELKCATEIPSPTPVDAHQPVSIQAMEDFYAHLEQTLITIDFLDPNNPRKLMRRLRRLFNRAQPDESEMNILRGILTAAGKSATKNNS